MFKGLNINFEKGNKKEYKMNLGLDLDGVVFDQEGFQFKCGIPYFKKMYIKEIFAKTGKKLKLSDIQVYDIVTKKQFNSKKDIDKTKPYITINSNGYGIKEVFNCNTELETDFWKKNMIKYALFAPFRPDSVRTIKKLSSESYGIFPITARAKANENNFIGFMQRSFVILRLKLKGIPYEKISFGSYKEGQEINDKVNACNVNNIDVMIEDKKSNAIAIEKGSHAKSFLFATKNNSDIKNDDIQRFVDFGEMYTGIKKYEYNQKFNVLHVVDREQLSEAEKVHYFEAYRNYLKETTHDAKITEEREDNLKNLITVAKFFFDKAEKNIVINEDRKPKEDGVIITTNHHDMLDIPHLLGAIGPRAYHPMLKSELLQTNAGQILTDLGFIFIDRNDKSVREQSRETAAKRLLSGSNVIICPEGTRNTTEDELLPFGFGAVSIAQISGKPIYPCAIYKSIYGKIINFGNPIYVGISDSLEEKNKMLFNSTLKLILESRKYEAERIQTESQDKSKSLIRKVS